jgi:hypothetical protein
MVMLCQMGLCRQLSSRTGQAADAGKYARPGEKQRCREAFATCLLQFREPQCPLTTGHYHPAAVSRQDRPWQTLASSGLRAPDLEQLALDDARRSRHRIKGTHLPRQLFRREAPVQRRLTLVDLGRIRYPTFRLWLCRQRQPRQYLDDQASALSPPTCRAALKRYHLLAIGTTADSSTGPLSSPASICMIDTPVCVSPARIARCTGAAPRHRGSSEA